MFPDLCCRSEVRRGLSPDSDTLGSCGVTPARCARSPSGLPPAPDVGVFEGSNGAVLCAKRRCPAVPLPLRSLTKPSCCRYLRISRGEMWFGLWWGCTKLPTPLTLHSDPHLTCGCVRASDQAQEFWLGVPRVCSITSFPRIFTLQCFGVKSRVTLTWYL